MDHARADLHLRGQPKHLEFGRGQWVVLPTQVSADPDRHSCASSILGKVGSMRRELRRHEMRTLILVITCAAGACVLPSPSALPPDAGALGQASYEYPGCPNEDYYCPRLKTVYCALEEIRRAHAFCSAPSDCVEATFSGRCTGMGPCPPPLVNAAERANYLAAVEAEVDRYCWDAGCASAGSCGWQPNDHVVGCPSGTCTWLPRSDGGS